MTCAHERSTSAPGKLNILNGMRAAYPKPEQKRCSEVDEKTIAIANLDFVCAENQNHRYHDTEDHRYHDFEIIGMMILKTFGMIISESSV